MSATFNKAACLVVDCFDALLAQLLDTVAHLLELFGRVACPRGDLADDAQRIAGAVGAGRIAGEFPIGEVGVVLELAVGRDDVDALARLALSRLSLRQFGAPDRSLQSRGEVDEVRCLDRAVVGHEAGDEEVAGFQIGLAAMIERAGIERIGYGWALQLSEDPSCRRWGRA